MAGFDRRRRAGIDDKLTYIGRGSIQGALFDLGPLSRRRSPRRTAASGARSTRCPSRRPCSPRSTRSKAIAPTILTKPLYAAQQTDVVLPDGSRAPRLGLLLQRAARPGPADRVRRLSRTRKSAMSDDELERRSDLVLRSACWRLESSTRPACRRRRRRPASSAFPAADARSADREAGRIGLGTAAAAAAREAGRASARATRCRTRRPRRAASARRGSGSSTS